jgi:hypothetical protein
LTSFSEVTPVATTVFIDDIRFLLSDVFLIGVH